MQGLFSSYKKLTPQETQAIQYQYDQSKGKLTDQLKTQGVKKEIGDRVMQHILDRIKGLGELLSWESRVERDGEDLKPSWLLISFLDAFLADEI